MSVYESERGEELNKQLWVDYISAAVHLYGIAPFGQVAEMISSQTGEEVSEHDIKQWIEDPFRGSLAQAALQKKFVYLYRGDFFVAEWIAIFDEFDDHWARQQGKPFYVPEQEELLLWSDPHYFHKPDQYYALVEFIETKFAGVSEEYVQGIAEDIQMMAEDPFSLERVLSEFERRDLNLTAKQIQSLMQIVTDLHNNTRQQVNRGHTPYELLQLEKTSLRPLPVGQVGRNDPCPCGSGKKYKKCCGK